MRGKKILSLVAAAALTLSAILPAQAATYDSLAADTNGIVTTYETVTISDIPEDAASLEFDTYQVLYATYDEESNSFAYHLTGWAATALSSYSEADAITAIAALTTDGTSTTEQTDIVNTLGAYIAANSPEEWDVTWAYDPGDTSATADLPVGAYVVIPNSTNMAFLNMLVSVDAVAAGSNNQWETSANGAKLKGNLVSVTKVVKETAIADEVADESTDVQIGENVSYTITADVPRFANNASDIKFQIVDKPSNVEIDMDTLKVYGVNGTTEDLLVATTNYTAAYEDGVLTISFSEKYLSTFWNGSTYPYASVKITYDAELLSTAAVNAENENEVTLTYGDANNTENSATDTADVYTYKVVLTKEDTDEEPLSDAVFELTDADGTVIYFVQDGSTYRVADFDDATKTSELTTGTDGMLTIIGLDADKEYTLEETKAPSGYSINSHVLVFTIEAPATLDSKVADVDTTEYTDNTKDDPATEESWAAEVETDGTQINLSLTDTEIPELPATGSTGIVIFTVIGVVIMIAAVFFMNSSKSKKNA